MKRIFFTIGFIIAVVFSANAQTFNVPNSPFVITKTTTTVQVPCNWGSSVTQTRYQYYLSVRPQSLHAGLQRIEYVGFRVVYQNSMRYFQLYPTGGIREISNPNQALYEPSKLVLAPSSVGLYKLFSEPIPNNLQVINGSVCLNNNIAFFNLPDPTKIKAINFMAGYGFLTNENLVLIARQKALENDPMIQQHLANAQTMDIQTMKWALAQGNMFQHKAYYNVFDLNYTCQSNNSGCGSNNNGWGAGL
ncbi:MAG: hypothetical protein GY699_23645 [Desulfobacteraceae bacterium]|nr:hypothetical protein [Desulfobacteraceae bacterium]